MAWSSSKVNGAGRLFQKTAKPAAARNNPKTQIPNPKCQCFDRPEPLLVWDLGCGTWDLDLLRPTPLVQHLIDACDRRFLEPRTVDVAVMLAMRGQIDPLCRIGNRHFLIVKRLRLIPEVAQEHLEICDLLFAFEGFAVSGDDRLEVQRLQFFEVGGPLVVKPEVERARHRTFEEIARRDN